MTLQQFDDVLNSWKARLSAIAENLMELQSDATYQSLTGTGGLEKVAVEGATAARLGTALRTMNELFLEFGLLQGTIDRAVEIRGELPSLFGSEPRLQAMYQLLFTRSIDLESSHVPLAERQLLSGTQNSQWVSPDELLHSMMLRFSQVRDAVAIVGQAWAEYGAGVERLEAEVSRYRSQTAMPSKLLAPMLEGVAEKLHGTQARMMSDPLGALAALRSQVEPALASVSQRITVAESVGEKLRAARSRWLLLDEVHRETATVVAEARARLAAHCLSSEPVPEAKVQAVSEWLARLDRKRDEGAFEAVTIGLRNWTTAAEACIAQEKKLLAECESQLASRGELRGRLDALTAKARARGLAEDRNLASLRSDAETVLSGRPTDLGLAAEAVARFEHRLRAYSVLSEGVQSAGSR